MRDKKQCQAVGVQVKCPACGRRFFDKEDKASGFIIHKCFVCKNIWKIDLATLNFMILKKPRGTL